MADIRVVQIPPQGVLSVLPLPMAGKAPTIIDALASIENRSHGSWSVLDFLKGATSPGGRDRLWAVCVPADQRIRAIAGTCIKLTGHGERQAHIQFATGESAVEWRDQLLDEIEGWAAANECARVLPFIRRGWQEWFRSRGYRVRHVEMERVLR